MHDDTLARVGLFSGLNKKELHHIANNCQERKFSSGTVLMQQGDTGAGLFVLISGKVKITQTAAPDGAAEELGMAGPDEVLGEMSLLDDLPRSATVTAVEDTTALLLPIWDFRTSLRNNPEIAVKLLAALSHRLRKAESHARARD